MHIEKLRHAANEAALRHSKAQEKVDLALAAYRKAHRAVISYEAELARIANESNTTLTIIVDSQKTGAKL